MAGGDGSQAAVASVAARCEVPFVCVPAGTRNHFALDLGLDRTDVVGALDAYDDQVARQIDLAVVNGRTFVNNCSLGLYAKVVQSPQYRDAKIRTAAEMLPDLIGPDADPLDLSFAGPGGEEFTTAHLILVSNNPYQLARPGGRGTREHLDLGVLGIVAVQVGDAAEARHFMMLELTGQVQRFDRLAGVDRRGVHRRVRRADRGRHRRRGPGPRAAAAVQDSAGSAAGLAAEERAARLARDSRGPPADPLNGGGPGVGGRGRAARASSLTSRYLPRYAAKVT